MPDRTADAAHEPDRMPSTEEEETAEAAAEELRESGEERTVAEHYEDMARRGVDQQGEGRIE
jgi:hypothetical protein